MSSARALTAWILLGLAFVALVLWADYRDEKLFLAVCVEKRSFAACQAVWRAERPDVGRTAP